MIKLGFDTLPTNFEYWYLVSESTLIKFNKRFHKSAGKAQHDKGVIVCDMEVFAIRFSCLNP